MHQEPQEFEKLRKLLALKRRELPPPGYFETFSQKLIGRIEFEQVSRTGWWAQVLELFRLRPAVSWSFSVAAVLALFVAGTGWENSPTSPQAQSLPSLGSNSGSASASLAFSTNTGAGAFGPQRITLERIRATTNAEPGFDSLFSTPFYQQVQPVPVSYGFTD